MAAWRILNVNDRESSRYFVSRVLTREGYEVVDAKNGREALALAVARKPDVVILDVKLPDLSGYEVCRRLKAATETASIAVVQTSAAYVSGEQKARGLASGADAYLAEPYEPIELVAIVKALLRLVVSQRESHARAVALLEADRRKDQFMAMLSHELRNPLSAILTGVRLLEPMLEGDARTKRIGASVERQAKHLTRLVDDLLDVSRIAEGKIHLHRARVDVVVAVQAAIDAARPVLDARGHTLETALPGGPLWVDGDATRLAQVFGNLLHNAAKYTETGGRIALRVERAMRDERPMAVVFVRDDGIGIAPEHIASLFDMFYQVDGSMARSQSGLGIGLTMVRRLVELHGGRVTAHSDGVGKGTELRVELPLAASASDGVGTPTSRTMPPGARPLLRVLVVDDNPDAGELLQVALEAAGHDVERSFDGESAVALACRGEHDVAIVDIGLPGLDGYEVARRIVATLGARRPSLVALTGYGRPEERAQALAAGFDVHLLKPVDLDQLDLVLASVRGRSAPLRADSPAGEGLA